MQQIIDECGCGKNLLYREFASKDELVAAYLERCQAEWSAIMEDATRPHAGDPAGQLVAMVRAVARQVADARLPTAARSAPRTPSSRTRTIPAHRVSVAHVRTTCGGSCVVSPNRPALAIRRPWPTG